MIGDEEISHRIGGASTQAMELPPPSSVFDIAIALQQCFHDWDLFAEMIEYFFAEIEALFPRLDLAVARGDLSEVGYLGHRLMGTVAYLGADRASEAIRWVERFENDSGNRIGLAEATRKLKRECNALKAALLAHLAAV